MCETRQGGIDLINRAQAAEQAGDYPGAVKLYTRGIEWLQTSQRYEQSTTIKTSVNKKMREYLERAEELAELIKKSKTTVPEKAAPAAAAAAAAGPVSDSRDLSGIVRESRPSVTWDDVAGLHSVKTELRASVVYPEALPQLYRDSRMTRWNGVLLFGPPGTGKTMLAEAVASQVPNATFLDVQVANVMNKYVGESERTIKAIFDLARKRAPTVMFIDEIDCIMSARTDGENDAARKVKNQVLVELNQLGSDPSKYVMVLAATNLPGSLDEAFRRRMQKRIYIPLPDADARRALLQQRIGTALSADNVAALVARTDGWSGSDLNTLINAAKNRLIHQLESATHFRAGVNGLEMCDADQPGALPITMDELISADRGKEIVPPAVCMDDFEFALRVTRPTASAEMVRNCEQFKEQYGSGTA